MAILSNSPLDGVSVTQLTLTSILAYIAFYLVTYKANVPQNLPWVGRKAAGYFSEKKATYGAFSNLTTWLGEGYQKYSKLGKSYVLPTFEGNLEIVIPNNKLQWLLEHDDQEVSVQAVHYDTLAGDYAFTDRYLLQNLYHEHVLHKNLARKIGALIPNTWEELIFMMDRELGTSTEWTEVPVMETFQTVVTAVSNRMFTGLPICRDKDFLDLCSKFANDVGLMIGLWSFVPRKLRFILGPLLAIPNNYHARKIHKYTRPVVEQHLAAFKHNEEHPEDPVEVSDDYITWHIRYAKADGNAFELTPEMICKRILPIEFAAIHTTTFTIVNVLLDLMGSNPADGFIEGLREEAERVYKEFNGEWNKVAISKLVRADSTLRESLRVSTFMTRSVSRQVVSPHGLTSPDEGWTAPKGSILSINLWTRQHDPDFYPNPDKFDAFRFSRQAETSESYLESAKLSFVSTGESFLPFGHGKHACPGRFFVNQELKLMLAYLVMNYEIAYMEKRPENVKLGSSVIPPAGVKMRIRRRNDAVVG